MSEQANYFKIGIFVISATVLTVGAVIVLGAGAIFRETIMVESYFDESVQGLDIGSPVKYRGIKIGKVEVIDAAGREYGGNSPYVMVRSSLFADMFEDEAREDFESGLRKSIEKGLRVRLVSQGLTGAVYIEADFLDPGRFQPLEITWNPNHLRVPSAESTITRLSDSLDGIMRNLEKINIHDIIVRLERIMDTLNHTLEGADIEWVSLEAHKLLSELRDTNRHLGQLIGGEETHRVISEAASTLASARRIVENAEKPASEFLTAMAETRSVMKEASAAMTSLRRVIENVETPVNSVLGDLRDTAANTNALTGKLGQFPEELNRTLAQLQSTLVKFDQLASVEQQDIEITLNNIRLISEHLEELTDDIRQYPSHLLFGDPPEPLNLEKE